MSGSGPYLPAVSSPSKDATGKSRTLPKPAGSLEGYLRKSPPSADTHGRETLTERYDSKLLPIGLLSHVHACLLEEAALASDAAAIAIITDEYPSPRQPVGPDNSDFLRHLCSGRRFSEWVFNSLTSAFKDSVQPKRKQRHRAPYAQSIECIRRLPRGKWDAVILLSGTTPSSADVQAAAPAGETRRLHLGRFGSFRSAALAWATSCAKFTGEAIAAWRNDSKGARACDLLRTAGQRAAADVAKRLGDTRRAGGQHPGSPTRVQILHRPSRQGALHGGLSSPAGSSAESPSPVRWSSAPPAVSGVTSAHGRLVLDHLPPAAPAAWWAWLLASPEAFNVLGAGRRWGVARSGAGADVGAGASAGDGAGDGAGADLSSVGDSMSTTVLRVRLEPVRVPLPALEALLPANVWKQWRVRGLAKGARGAGNKAGGRPMGSRGSRGRQLLMAASSVGSGQGALPGAVENVEDEEDEAGRGQAGREQEPYGGMPADAPAGCTVQCTMVDWEPSPHGPLDTGPPHRLLVINRPCQGESMGHHGPRHDESTYIRGLQATGERGGAAGSSGRAGPGPDAVVLASMPVPSRVLDRIAREQRKGPSGTPRTGPAGGDVAKFTARSAGESTSSRPAAKMPMTARQQATASAVLRRAGSASGRFSGTAPGEVMGRGEVQHKARLGGQLADSRSGGGGIAHASLRRGGSQSGVRATAGPGPGPTLAGMAAGARGGRFAGTGHDPTLGTGHDPTLGTGHDPTPGSSRKDNDGAPPPPAGHVGAALPRRSSSAAWSDALSYASSPRPWSAESGLRLLPLESGGNSLDSGACTPLAGSVGPTGRSGRAADDVPPLSLGFVGSSGVAGGADVASGGVTGETDDEYCDEWCLFAQLEPVFGERSRSGSPAATDWHQLRLALPAAGSMEDPIGEQIAAACNQAAAATGSPQVGGGSSFGTGWISLRAAMAQPSHQLPTELLQQTSKSKERDPEGAASKMAISQSACSASAPAPASIACLLSAGGNEAGTRILRAIVPLGVPHTNSFEGGVAGPSEARATAMPMQWACLSEEQARQLQAARYQSQPGQDSGGDDAGLASGALGNAQAALIGGTIIEGAAHDGAVLRLLDGPRVNERVHSMLALQVGANERVHSMLALQVGANERVHSMLALQVGANERVHSMLALQVGANERVHSMLALQVGATGSHERKGGDMSMVLGARLSRKLAGLLVRAAEGAQGPAVGLHADEPEAAASTGEMPEVRPTLRDRAKLRAQERGERAAAAARGLLQRYAGAGTAGGETGRSVACGRLLCEKGAAAVLGYNATGTARRGADTRGGGGRSRSEAGGHEDGGDDGGARVVELGTGMVGPVVSGVIALLAAQGSILKWREPFGTV